jgi:hypothetical protein
MRNHKCAYGVADHWQLELRRHRREKHSRPHDLDHQAEQVVHVAVEWCSGGREWVERAKRV